MKSVKFLLCLLFFFSVALCQAQDDEYDSDEDIKSEKKETERKNDITDWESRLFLNFSNAFLVDFISSPLTYFDVEFTDPGDIKRIEQGASQTSYLSYYTVGFEPRYNVYEFKKNLSLAVSVPLGIGFGQAYASHESVRGGTGIGNIQVPLLLRVYYGAGSTFKSMDDFGLDIGAGLEYNKLGVLDLGFTEKISGVNEGWLMPAAIVGIHFYRGISPIEVNLKYGFGPVQEQFDDQFGSRLLDGKRNTRASSIKLNFVYTLNN